MVTALPQSSASRSSLIVSLLIVWVVWGSTYLAIQFAIESIPPFFMIGSRFGLAGLVMYAWLRASGRAARPTANQWKHAAIMGGLMLSAGTGLVAWAEQTVPSGIAALLVATSPVVMVLLEWLWKGGLRPSVSVFAGLALGFVGVTILVDTSSITGGAAAGVDIRGAAAILVATLAWSTATIHGRDADQPSNVFLGSAMQMFAGGMILVVVSLLMGELSGFDVGAVTAASLAGWSYLILIGSFVAFSAYVHLIRNATAASISTYAYVNPIVAVFLGWLIADEVIDARVLAAAAILVIAVVLIMRDRNRRRAPERRWYMRGRSRPASL